MGTKDVMCIMSRTTITKIQQVRTTFSYLKNLCNSRIKIHTHSHTQSGTMSLCIIHNITTITTIIATTLTKVTKSHYLVIVLGQLPFTLFIEIAQTWVVQRESVNTAIIQSYLTLPRNGRIHGLN